MSCINCFLVFFSVTATPLTNFKMVQSTTSEQLSALEQLREVVLEKQSVLTAALKVMRSLSESAHKLAFDSVFSQIDHHLHGLPDMEVDMVFHWWNTQIFHLP